MFRSSNLALVIVVKINSLKQRVDLQMGLRRRRQRSFSAFAGRAQEPEGALVRLDVLLELALELGEEVVDHAVVEVLAAQVRVAGRGLHFKNALLDGEEGHVEGAAAQVEDEDVSFIALLVQTVRDGRGRRLVDDAQDVQSSNGSSILRGLALGVVEVGRHGHDRVVRLPWSFAMISTRSFCQTPTQE